MVREKKFIAAKVSFVFFAPTKQSFFLGSVFFSLSAGALSM